MAQAAKKTTQTTVSKSTDGRVLHVQVKDAAPTTTVKGQVVQVTGTKGGAISMAATQAKAVRLKGSPTPANVGKYAGSATVRILKDEDGVVFANPSRAGTYRAKAWDAMAKSTTAGAYALTGYKPKYLERWVKQGFIRVG